MHNRLQVGIDFSQKRADFCLLFPDGRPLESHLAFDNSFLGYSLAKQLLLDALDSYSFDGIDVSGEATGYLWLPFFLQLAADPELEAPRFEALSCSTRVGSSGSRSASLRTTRRTRKTLSTSPNARARGVPM